MGFVQAQKSIEATVNWKPVFFGGFIIGGAATFYVLPHLEGEFGVFKRPGIQQIQAFEPSSVFKNNELEEIKSQNLSKNVYLAIELSKSAGENKPASNHSLSIIEDIAKNHQSMRKFISDVLSSKDNITNADALIIFEQYLSSTRSETVSGWND